eukprot:GHVT01094610.1.p1 GENE.GHVT01094610.1~~GHVT01094610.1.p1  ORF type:complete len:383 (+),score=74.61 GHVT01094610.1:14-1162(+)
MGAASGEVGRRVYVHCLQVCSCSCSCVRVVLTLSGPLDWVTEGTDSTLLIGVFQFFDFVGKFLPNIAPLSVACGWPCKRVAPASTAPSGTAKTAAPTGSARSPCCCTPPASASCLGACKKAPSREVAVAANDCESVAAVGRRYRPLTWLYFGPRVLFGLSLLRIAFIPLVVCIARFRTTAVLSSFWFRLLVLAVFGLSNGWFETLALMLGPATVKKHVVETQARSGTAGKSASQPLARSSTASSVCPSLATPPSELRPSSKVRSRLGSCAAASAAGETHDHQEVKASASSPAFTSVQSSEGGLEVDSGFSDIAPSAAVAQRQPSQSLQQNQEAIGDSNAGFDHAGHEDKSNAELIARGGTVGVLAMLLGLITGVWTSNLFVV